jgi:hypothetical protein
MASVVLSMQAIQNVFKTNVKSSFLHFMTNLFYDMQSEFQNKLLLSKKTREVHFITFLNIF